MRLRREESTVKRENIDGRRDRRLDVMEKFAGSQEPGSSGQELSTLADPPEDDRFALLLPSEYWRLARSLQRTLLEDTGRLGMLAASLQDLVQRQGIAFALQSRLKGLYSLYRKMLVKNRGIEGIRDRAGVRIIVSSIDDCYRVLGLVHTHFAYVPGTFDDYIGAPKPNGYRSLHTCVSAGNHLTAEIQIRTLQMHMEAEYGVAAHWRYKQLETGNQVVLTLQPV